MKVWITVAISAFLSSVCHSNPLDDQKRDLANLQDFKVFERIEGLPYKLHGYAGSEADINHSNAEDGHFDIALVEDSSYRRRPNRHCICYRRSSRRRSGGGGWRPLPRPYK